MGRTKMNTALYKEIGKKVKAQREKAGLSQSDLGEMLECPYQSIHKLEAGKSPVSIEKILKLSALFKCSPLVLLPKVPAIKLSKVPLKVEQPYAYAAKFTF